MEMTAYYSDSSCGACREEVFKSKLLNIFVLQQHFHERTLEGGGIAYCTGQLAKAKIKPEFHAWLCQELLCDSG